MTDFRIGIDIDAPPERVWAIMSDVQRWPEWTPTVTSVRLLDPGATRRGQPVRNPPAEAAARHNGASPNLTRPVAD